MNPKDRVGSKKPGLCILPFAVLYEVCLAFIEGARKYGPWNWRDEQVTESIYVDAAIRHLTQWMAGEDTDPDSGLPHISKAIAGLLILRDAQMHGCSYDDRKVPQDLYLSALSDKIKVIHEKYPGESPSEARTINLEFCRAYLDGFKIETKHVGMEAVCRGGNVYKIINVDDGADLDQVRGELVRLVAEDGEYCHDFESWQSDGTWRCPGDEWCEYSASLDIIELRSGSKE